LNNWFGPDVRGEHVQFSGTDGNIVTGNHFDATGLVFKNGVYSSVVGIFNSSDNTWSDNVVTNLAGSGTYHGFYVLGSGAQNNVFHRNAVSGSFGYAIKLQGGSGNVVFCDNTETGTGTL